MSNRINQYSNSDFKKAFVSIGLGIVSVITTGVGYILLYGTYHWMDRVLIIFSLSVPLIGIILGKMSFKSARKVALAGLLLNVIGLVEAIFFDIIILFWSP